jgi:hypothetical protein
MPDDVTHHARTVGRYAAFGVFVVGVLYAIVTGLGFLSLESADYPIGDPYFTIMELLIIVIVVLMLAAMVSVQQIAQPTRRIYGMFATICMAMMAGITSSLHFVILTVGKDLEATGERWVPLVTSFEWPSVVYALDILAWDWFFALSMLSGALVFQGPGLARRVRILMLVSGALSLAGLIGVPLSNMQYRNIGIIGYGIVAPIAFLCIGILFGRSTDSAGVAGEGWS